MKNLDVKAFYSAFIILFVIGCSEKQVDNPLETVLASNDMRIKKVMDSLGQHEVQIRYTQIDRNGDSLMFTDHDFQVDEDRYFYPASTVKFPAAVAALEKLNELDTLDRDFRFYVEGDSVETTFSEAILQIFAVSDNEANNRLVEFLGFDDLNHRMQRRGVEPIRISHRLSTPNADEVTAKPLVIYLNDSTTGISKSITSKSPKPLDFNGIKKGSGFYAQDSLYQEPFDFSLKNYYPVEAQHALLKRIIFPEAFPKEEQFNLNEAQQKFLLDAMKILPKKIGYDSEEYYDSYGKFFMYGDSKEAIPEHIEIYNKVGYAYGTLTDCAYIKDTKNNIDFMLTATILVNSDSIFNDDQYEFDEVGIPFLAQLGREIYQHELNRKR
ncbi:serine hydrolase [Allomuricauda sp. d1]|uniref:serine hydrolase n=1 Tax=Allomuricauda sp. d1 TaxID=3136725 RepID=UPI0031CF2579